MKDQGWWVFDTITNEINSRVVNLAPRCIQQVVVVDDDAIGIVNSYLPLLLLLHIGAM